jgi:acetoin utilization deacetylase AcuC-like enzyme
LVIMSHRMITHPAMLAHDSGPGHPESSMRLRAVLDALEGEEFQDLLRQSALPAEDADLRLIHSLEFCSRLADQIPITGGFAIDADTFLTASAEKAARLAVGAVCAGVDAVLRGLARTVFCAVRPPGHHAEPEQAMGFCFYNSVAIGAAHALGRHGLRRVAIVDFDVHHGNGTQKAAWANAGIFYASTHEAPLYPGTGAAIECGAYDNILNVPLPAYSNGAAFRAAYTEKILPALERFKPELVMISAGFDGHRRDPLASWQLEAEDFAWLSCELCKIAERHAGGRVVSALEGGYDPTALAHSSRVHQLALMGSWP